MVHYIYLSNGKRSLLKLNLKHLQRTLNILFLVDIYNFSVISDVFQAVATNQQLK
jgi:hypothetical protein